MKPTIGILCALDYEATHLTKQLHLKRVQSHPVPIHCGEIFDLKILLAIAGMGWNNAESAVLTLQTFQKLDLVIISGFCGATQSGLKPGDIVIGDTVAFNTTEEKSGFRIPEPALQECNGTFRVQHAKVWSDSGVISGTTARQEVFDRTGALAIDMESAGAVAAARKAGLNWMIVRAVTDSPEYELPLDFAAFMTPDQKLNYLKFFLHLIRHPLLIPAVFRLQKISQIAAENLGKYLLEVVRVLGKTRILHS